MRARVSMGWIEAPQEPEEPESPEPTAEDRAKAEIAVETPDA